MLKPNPVPDSFMLVGMVGLLISFILTYYGSINQTYGFTLGLFFGVMLLASLLSMSPRLPGDIERKQRAAPRAPTAMAQKRATAVRAKPAAKRAKKPAKKAAKKARKAPAKKAAKKKAKRKR